MPISRVEISDYFEVGRLIAKWAKQDPASRPSSIAEMRNALSGIALVPARITNVQWVQPDLQTLLMRLPNKDMLIESEQTFSATSGQRYPIPNVYLEKLTNPNTHVSDTDFLFARIADYTIAQCR